MARLINSDDPNFQTKSCVKQRTSGRADEYETRFLLLECTPPYMGERKWVPGQYTSMPDDALIRASQQGDRSAFAELLVSIYDLIFRFAMTWAGNVSDAEDITQLACIKLARVIRQFRFESAFSTWLYRMVINCAKDWGRSEMRHRRADTTTHAMSEGDEPCSSSTSIEAHSELQRVLEHVDQMGKGYKETLILVYAEGMTHKEAGDILGIKESTVSWRLHDIRKRMENLEPRSTPPQSGSL